MLIDLATAKLHLRVVDAADDAMITIYSGAAERAVVEYAQRNIYADGAALAAAIAAAPAALVAATVTYDAAILAADPIPAGIEWLMAEFAANEAYTRAQTIARMTYQGIVVNDQIKAAILLTIGHLYANREDSVIGVSAVALPMGCNHLMQPLRAY